MTKSRPIVHDAAAAFFECLGRCIAAWANVDEELFRIFYNCLGPPEQSAIIYYRLGGLDMRLGLTNEIVLSILPRKTRINGGHDHLDVKRWSKLEGEFRNLLHVRRRIAHHPVAVEGDRWFGFAEAAEFSSEMIGSFGFASLYSGGSISPPELKIKVGEQERHRSNAASLPALSLVDLKQHLAQVRVLSNDLNEFLRTGLTPALEERRDKGAAMP